MRYRQVHSHVARRTPDRAHRRARRRHRVRGRIGLAVLGAASVAVAAVVMVGIPMSRPPDPRPEPPPAAPPRWVVDPSATDAVSDLIGPDAAGGDTLERFGVAGTDLGHMFTVDGRLAVVFGDTYGGPSASGNFFAVPHQDWRSNVLGFIDPPSSPRDGLTLSDMVTDRPGHAAEVLHSLKQDGVERTVIPTYGISVGHRMLLHYMSVRRFTSPGRWTLNDAGVAVSDDGGRTWSRPASAVWPGDTRFGQVAYVRPGGPDDPRAPDGFSVPGEPDLMRMYPGPQSPSPWVYVYGIPGGRYGDVSLAVVRADEMLDRSAYRYWTGTGWSTSEQDAAPLVHGPVGELSVRWNSFYRRWLMMYLVNPTGQIVIRTATSPTGPWGEPQVVTTTHDHPESYAPYLIPGRTDGPDIWFTMSQYTTYRVTAMHTELRAQPPRGS